MPPFLFRMSMFSGFTNQISGWVATKTGSGHPEEDPNAQPPMAPENGAEMMGGEECVAGEGQVNGGSDVSRNCPV